MTEHLQAVNFVRCLFLPRTAAQLSDADKTDGSMSLDSWCTLALLGHQKCLENEQEIAIGCLMRDRMFPIPKIVGRKGHVCAAVCVY